MKDDVTVVAAGWSVLNVAIDRLCGVVIGVNDAAVHLPRADIVVSMDRQWTEHRWAWILERHAQAAWLRRSAVQNIEIRPNMKWITVFDCDHTDNAPPSLEPGHLNGTSSGMCALNLALQMAPPRVFMLGFDMQRDRFGRARWYGGYEWKKGGTTSNGTYRAWAGQFGLLAAAFKERGIEVWNVSPSSAIDAFPKMKPSDYMRECT